MKWVMIFVLMTPAGEFRFTELDSYNTLDECMWALDDAIIDGRFDEIKPLNWEFMCLEDVRERV